MSERLNKPCFFFHPVYCQSDIIIILYIYIIKINNIAIQKSTNFKFLGILIDENRNWKMQINNIKNKLYYGLSLLYRYKYKFNINTLVMLYFSFFQSY